MSPERKSGAGWLGPALLLIGAGLLAYSLFSFEGRTQFSTSFSGPEVAYHWYYHYDGVARAGIAAGAVLLAAGIMLKRRKP